MKSKKKKVPFGPASGDVIPTNKQTNEIMTEISVLEDQSQKMLGYC